jgi:hypothetical protein
LATTIGQSVGHRSLVAIDRPTDQVEQINQISMPYEYSERCDRGGRDTDIVNYRRYIGPKAELAHSIRIERHDDRIAWPNITAAATAEE